MRGVVRGPSGGIIPAYAGSTCVRGRVAGLSRDHPRIRGEHSPRHEKKLIPLVIIPAYAGSTCGGCGRRSRRGGIIPAYAGSTAGPPHQTAPFPDHPRIRGEHSAPARARARIAGSSPHTRGARQAPAQTRTPRWIIPAYAGSTTSSPPPAVGHGDHPRIRGEHLRGGAAVISAVGSSPRVCIGILMRSSTWRSIFLCRGGTFTGG